MNDIQKKTLKEAIKLLGVLKVKYAILDLEGVYHGDLEIKREPIKAKRLPRNYAYGALSGYLRPYVATLQIGDTAVIPHGPFALEHVARSTSSMVHRLWGMGNSRLTLVREANSVEVIRVG